MAEFPVLSVTPAERGLWQVSVDAGVDRQIQMLVRHAAHDAGATVLLAHTVSTRMSTADGRGERVVAG